MYIWKDKEGKKLKPKEFFSRWKTGIKGVNVYQQTCMQVVSTIIMIVGILLGIVISLFFFKTTFWLTIILVGALGNTLVQFLALLQKKKGLEPFFKSQKDDSQQELQNFKESPIQSKANEIIDDILNKQEEAVTLVTGEEKQGMASASISMEDHLKEDNNQGIKDEDLRSGKSSGDTTISEGSEITEQSSSLNRVTHPEIQQESPSVEKLFEGREMVASLRGYKKDCVCNLSDPREITETTNGVSANNASIAHPVESQENQKGG
jgi:hypothetical protein